MAKFYARTLKDEMTKAIDRAESLVDSVLEKGQAGSERPGHKYTSRKARPGGGFVYRYGPDTLEVQPTHNEGEFFVPTPRWGKSDTLKKIHEHEALVRGRLASAGYEIHGSSHGPASVGYFVRGSVTKPGRVWKQNGSMLDGFSRDEIKEIAVGVKITNRLLDKHGSSRILAAARELNLPMQVGMTGLYMESGQRLDEHGMLTGTSATVVDVRYRLMPYISLGGMSLMPDYTLKLKDGRTVESSPISMRNFSEKNHAKEHPAATWAWDRKPVTKAIDDAESAVESLIKGVAGSEKPGHKYLRRIAKPGGGFRRVYKESEGKAEKKQEPTEPWRHPILATAVDAAARYMAARKEGDVSGAKHIKKVLDAYLKKHNIPEHMAYEAFGDPDDPKQRDEAHRKIDEHIGALSPQRLSRLVKLIG